MATKWIAWGGGECPVAPGTAVNIKLRDGETYGPRGADFLTWAHTGLAKGARDIVAYQIVEEAKPADPADNVNHPAHYTAGGIECIDAIQAALTPEEFRGYCKGNAIKYVWRERHKGGAESIAKADWYLKRMQEAGE